MIKIQGLVASAELIVEAYDNNVDIVNQDYKIQENPSVAKLRVEQALKFLNSALIIDKTTEADERRTVFVYFTRAIVHSRLAILIRELDEGDPVEVEKRALNDLREAFKLDSEILLQAAFDKPLATLAEGTVFRNKRKGFEVKFIASDQISSLSDNFLKPEEAR